MSVTSSEQTRVTINAIDAPTLPARHDDRRRAPYRHWIRQAIVGDLFVGGVAAAAAGVLRFGGDAFGRHAFAWDVAGDTAMSYQALGVIIAFLWPLLAAACGAYELRTSLFGVEELRRVLRMGVTLLALLGTAHFIFRLDLARLYVGMLVPLIVILTGVWRVALRAWNGRSSRSAEAQHHAVAVGPVAEIHRLCLQLARRPGSGIRIVAFVADDLDANDPVPAPLDQLHRLPSRSAIGDLTGAGVGVDLLVRAGTPNPDEMWALSRRAQALGVAVAIAPRRQDASGSVPVSYTPLGSTPLLIVETPTLRPSAVVIKMAMDRVLGALMLLVAIPVLAVIAAVIIMRDGRPVFFRQRRVGRDGVEFDCFKLRTMCPDAEEQLAALLARNEADGPLFKVRDDPRLTSTGPWLRRHSLDELPQLWNVFKGEMSVVGPRPPLPSEVATYDERIRRRLVVKPGLTGLWQTEGRSNLPWDEGVYLDLMYIDHWSPLLDLVIIARSLKAVIRPEGAY